MKKQYINPEVRVRKTNPYAFICVSFGDGTTDTMHSKQNGIFGDEDQRSGFLNEDDDLLEK